MEKIKWKEYNVTLEVITFSDILNQALFKYKGVKALLQNDNFKTAYDLHVKDCKFCNYYYCAWKGKKEDEKVCPLHTFDICGHRHSTHTWISNIFKLYIIHDEISKHIPNHDQKRIMEGINEILSTIEEIKKKIK